MGGENPGCVSSFFAGSWRLADSIFAPRQCFLGEADEEIEHLYWMRSIVGIVIILCVAIRYHRFDGFLETLDAVFQGVGWAAEFAALSIVPAGIAVVLYTRPGKRVDALIQLRHPVTALGAWLLITYGYILLQGVLAKPRDNAALGLPLAILSLVVLAWFASFAIRTFYQMATGLLRLGDGHPLLPPAVTILAAWALVTKSLLAGSADGGEPAAVIIVLLVGGPISLTILAAFEVKRLKEKYPRDFPFRDGPLTLKRTSAASR
jgi:hypothetical protein